MIIPGDLFEQYKIPPIGLSSSGEARLLSYVGHTTEYVAEARKQMDVEHDPDLIWDFWKYGEVGYEGLPPNPLSIKHVMFIRIVEDGISALNHVLYDYLVLRDYSHFIPPPHGIRLQLLDRAFANEFYRLSELFKMYTRFLQKTGFVTREGMVEAREAFYKSHEGILSLRSEMLHRGAVTTAKEMAQIQMLDALHKNDKMVWDKESGEAETTARFIRKMADVRLTVFVDEGRLLAEQLRNILHMYLDLAIEMEDEGADENEG